MSAFAHFFERGPYFIDGSQLTDGVLYHYAAGTTTLQNTWTARDKASTQAQPLPSDANGLFSGYGDGLYKFVLKNADGDTLYTWDNVNLIDPPLSGEGAALASASTLTLGTDGNFFHVTGTTTITAISGTQTRVSLLFDSVLTLTHGASLVLNGGVDHVTVANDILEFLNDGGGVWRQVFVSSTILSDDVKVKKALPRVRLLDTTDGQEYDIHTGLADFVIQENTNTEASPTWADRLRYDKATTTWIFTGGISIASGTLAVTDGLMPPLPLNTGSGSSYTHEGDVTISSPQSLYGIHYYNTFVLDASITATVSAARGHVVLVASESITINGTMTGAGAGAPAGAAVGISTDGEDGSEGTDQAGGGGGGATTNDGGTGGQALIYEIPSHVSAWLTSQVQAGGTAGSGAGDGGDATSVTGRALPSVAALFRCFGGGGGASGGRNAGGGGGAGGAGGASIVLIAPTIAFGASSVLNTSGVAGATGGDGHGGGGGGGAGNVYLACHTLTDSGATFTMTGGAGGISSGSSGDGGDGGAGVKYVWLF